MRRIVSLIFEGRAGFELETEFKYKGLVFGQSSKGALAIRSVGRSAIMLPLCRTITCLVSVTRPIIESVSYTHLTLPTKA